MCSLPGHHRGDDDDCGNDDNDDVEENYQSCENCGEEKLYYDKSLTSASSYVLAKFHWFASFEILKWFSNWAEQGLQVLGGKFADWRLFDVAIYQIKKCFRPMCVLHIVQHIK